jgi:hypothetical protein
MVRTFTLHLANNETQEEEIATSLSKSIFDVSEKQPMPEEASKT